MFTPVQEQVSRSDAHETILSQKRNKRVFCGSLFSPRYEMFVRVRDFGEAHAALFPTSSLALIDHLQSDESSRTLGVIR